MERIDTSYVREGYTFRFIPDFLGVRLDGGQGVFGVAQGVIGFEVDLTWRLPQDQMPALVDSLSTSLPVLIPLVVDRAPGSDPPVPEDCVCWVHPNSLAVGARSSTTLSVTARFYAMKHTDLGG